MFELKLRSNRTRNGSLTESGQIQNILKIDNLKKLIITIDTEASVQPAFANTLESDYDKELRKFIELLEIKK